MPVAMKPIDSAMRQAWIMRVRMSAPLRSVPSQCSAEGAGVRAGGVELVAQTVAGE